MALDPALETAIFEATETAGQPRSVAQRLVAWLKAHSTGETSEEQDRQFHENVMAAIVLEEGLDAD